jgi:hypothetical protein
MLRHLTRAMTYSFKIKFLLAHFFYTPNQLKVTTSYLFVFQYFFFVSFLLVFAVLGSWFLDRVNFLHAAQKKTFGFACVKLYPG